MHGIVPFLQVTTSLVTFFFAFTGCKTELQMMYAGSKLGLVKDVGFTKVRCGSMHCSVAIATSLQCSQAFPS